MSEIMEQVRRQIAESYRVCPPPCPVDERRRELAEERERQARKEREAEEKRQVASNNWYAAVDDRVRTHFKDWAWDAIDERIGQHIDRHHDIFKDAVGEALGEALGRKAAQLRGEFKHAIEELLDEVAEKLRTMPGRLPVAKTWRPEGVTYEGEFVCHEGALYQARKDTAQEPGGSAWVCVARAGHDGLTPNLRGRHDAYGKYRRLDVVEFDGSSFVAVRDNPSSLPGDDGWQLLCGRGNRGPAGDVGLRGRKGERGARGEAAPTIVSWTLDRTNYRAVPTMSNGTQGAVLELRGLFEQFIWEASYAVEALPGS